MTVSTLDTEYLFVYSREENCLNQYNFREYSEFCHTSAITNVSIDKRLNTSRDGGSTAMDSKLPKNDPVPRKLAQDLIRGALKAQAQCIRS